MGVKAHYMYLNSESVYIDMEAYHYLAQKYARAVSRGYFADKLPKDVGWRKKIEPMYAQLKSYHGTGFGRLSKMKTANPYKNDTFRARRVKRKKKSLAAAELRTAAAGLAAAATTAQTITFTGNGGLGGFTYYDLPGL